VPFPVRIGSSEKRADECARGHVGCGGIRENPRASTGSGQAFSRGFFNKIPREKWGIQRSFGLQELPHSAVLLAQDVRGG
jgi:hypothetical protein